MSHYSECLVTPDIKWLGVHPSDIQTYNIASLPLQQADLLKLQSLRDKMSVTANKKLLKQVRILSLF